ncbi:unnamed protein product [Toxocara canis]|uniref:G_PROTEIN_RECEP_F1_2 domain-containing protein n=1 Tax=Toxocara canis TaxID=6265 RepID=A0A183UQ54_TOXCA|nr:unnamed protein product [Toxocara canis]
MTVLMILWDCALDFIASVFLIVISMHSRFYPAVLSVVSDCTLDCNAGILFILIYRVMLDNFEGAYKN